MNKIILIKYVAGVIASLGSFENNLATSMSTFTAPFGSKLKKIS